MGKNNYTHTYTMTTFNTKSSGLPSEEWFQKQDYETLAKIAELLYRTHKIKLDDDGWSEMTEDKVSERCHDWGIEDGTNMWHSINRLRNANGLPSWEEEHGSEEDGVEEDGDEEHSSEEDGDEEHGSEEDGDEEHGSEEDGDEEHGSEEDGSEED